MAYISCGELWKHLQREIYSIREAVKFRLDKLLCSRAHLSPLTVEEAFITKAPYVESHPNLQDGLSEEAKVVFSFLTLIIVKAEQGTPCSPLFSVPRTLSCEFFMAMTLHLCVNCFYHYKKSICYRVQVVPILQ